MADQITSSKPNILIIEWDEMRADAMSCAGSLFVKTPHLDRLAREGLRFVDHHSVSPLCAPARHAFFTSRYPHVNHAICGGMPLRSDIRYMPAILNDQGYRTAVVGKLHHTPRLETYGFRDAWITDSGLKGEGNAYLDWLAENGRADMAKPKIGDASKERRERKIGIGWGPDARPAEWTEPAFITKTGCDYLRKKRDGPFLLHLSYKPPHSPHFVPEPFASMELPTIPEFPHPSEMSREKKPRLLEHVIGRHGLDKVSDEEWVELRTFYYRYICYMDSLVGEILAVLDEQKLWDNTIVVFTSDHGVMLGEYGNYGKLFNYEPCTKIPLLVRLPGSGERGREIGVTCDLLDVMPTLFDYAGVPFDAGFQGVSLRPWVEGQRSDARDFYMELTAVQRPKDEPRSLHLYRRGLRSLPWKITYHRSRLSGGWDWIDEWELYNLESDPKERFNLADDPDAREAFETMRAKLLHAILEKDGDYSASDCRE